MKKTLLAMDKASVFYDGTFSEPVRLAHAEGLAVDADGNVWCGTENGDLLKIATDGSDMQLMGSTGGFLAGIAFDSLGNVYACDIKDGHVYKWNAETGQFSTFGDTTLAIPNYPVVDEARGVVYVSDSCSFDEPGPGIWQFDLITGKASLWYKENLSFANGMAMALDGNSLYVVESTEMRLAKISIGADGQPAGYEVYSEGLSEFPDGVALDSEGGVYVSCYEPSQIYKCVPGGAPQLLIHDRVATTIAHPTNMAFRGKDMFTSNLGRWHITKIEMDVDGPQLPIKPNT